MTQPIDPAPADDPLQHFTYDEAAYEPITPAVEPVTYQPYEALPAAQPGSPAGNRAGGRSMGRGSIVLTAVLAAALSAGGTFGIVELTMPAAAPAAANPPAQLTSTSTTAPTGSGAANQPIVQIAAAASPAVVTITASGSVSGRNSGTSIGSGMIVTSDGYILTNRHVVASGGTLTVQLPDGRQFTGTVVGTDPSHDVAVVKINATGLPTVTLGNSDKLEIGQLAVAIGDPLGTFAGTVTTGIVSGTDRSIDVRDPETGSAVHLTGLIQTDAAINEGNSGGPLLNAAGQVIGINTATDSSAEGIGFAVPVNIAVALLTQAEAGNATTN